ncbi:MAG: ATP-binding protein [Acidimicrobiia bacterium]|nr:ATP-binding protein [Acidimicrobiia bacterium]
MATKPGNRKLVVLGLLCVVGATFAITATLEITSLRGEIDQWTSQQADIVAEVVGESLNGVTADLEAVAAFVEQTNPTASQFDEFVDRIDGTASAVGVGYLTELDAADIDTHIATERQRQGDDYQLFAIDDMAEPVPVARTDRTAFYPVQYFALGSPIRSAIADDPDIAQVGPGLDAGYDPVWRTEIARALEVDGATFSGFTSLQLEFVTLDRVFFASVPVAANRDNSRGLVVAMMVEQLILPELDRTVLEEVVWEAIPPGSEAARVVGPNARTFPMDLPGTTWTLAIAPTDETLAELKGTPWWITASIATTLALLVALAAWLLLDRRSENQRTARFRQLAEDKDRFLASVSHELRTPLTVVSGLAYELRDQPEHLTADERGGLMDLLVEQTDELSGIVEDLLVAARSDIRKVAVHSQEVDLLELAEQVMESTGVHGTTRGEPGRAMADPQRVRQILRNLLTNARRYGGPEVRIDFADGADWTEISVADNGAGVPVEKRQSIFESYESAHAPTSDVRSVGLGLYISRNLARAMGGNLEYAYDGVWSHFRLRLPSAVGTRTQASLTRVPSGAVGD